MTQPEFNSNLRFPHGSGVVEALQNDLTLKASSSGHVLVAFPAAMRPEVDISQDLGRPDLRWRNLHVSGINDIPIAQFVSIDTQTTINGLSGAVTLDSPDGTILIGDNGQSIELSGLFTQASGAVLQQKCADIDTLSGLILPNPGQTSINGISGVTSIDSPNDTISVVVNGQVIELDAIFTWTSGQLLESLANASGVESLNGVSGVVDLTSPDGTVIINPNGQTIELTALPDAGQTSINGLSGAITLTSPNNSIFIGDNGQSIELSGIFTAASGAVLQQKCEDIVSVSGTVAGLPEKAVLEFTDVSGLSFVMYHGLNTENFTWNMWEKVDSGDIQNYVLPKTLRPSGVDHVEVGLSAAMIGTLIIVG